MPEDEAQWTLDHLQEVVEMVDKIGYAKDGVNLTFLEEEPVKAIDINDYPYLYAFNAETHNYMSTDMLK